MAKIKVEIKNAKTGESESIEITGHSPDTMLAEFQALHSSLQARYKKRRLTIEATRDRGRPVSWLTDDLLGKMKAEVN